MSAVYAVKRAFLVTYATAKEAGVFCAYQVSTVFRVNILNPLKVGPFQSNEQIFFSVMK